MRSASRAVASRWAMVIASARPQFGEGEPLLKPVRSPGRDERSARRTGPAARTDKRRGRGPGAAPRRRTGPSRFRRGACARLPAVCATTPSALAAASACGDCCLDVAISGVRPMATFSTTSPSNKCGRCGMWAMRPRQAARSSSASGTPSSQNTARARLRQSRAAARTACSCRRRSGRQARHARPPRCQVRFRRARAARRHKQRARPRIAGRRLSPASAGAISAAALEPADPGSATMRSAAAVASILAWRSTPSARMGA